MSNIKKIAWNTGVQIAGKSISTIFGVIIISLMTRYLGSKGFGYYSTANSFFQIFSLFLDFGIFITMIQMLGENKDNIEKENQITSATITLRILSGLIILGIVPLIGLFLPYDQPVKIILGILFIAFFSSSINQIVTGTQQRHLKMHIVAFAEIIGRTILLIGVIISIYYQLSLAIITIFVSLGSLVNLIINYYGAKKYASFKWNIDITLWKKIIKKSWPIGISIMFNLLYFKMDTVILSLVKSPTEVGIYSAAYRILEILSTIPFMLAGITLPILTNYWIKSKKEEFQKLLNQSYIAMTILALPLVVGILVIGTQGIILISGTDFILSGSILKILSVALLAIFFSTISSHVIVAINKQQTILKSYIIISIITIIGYIIFIPPYGIWAAAWLTVFSEVAIALITTFYINIQTKNSFPIKNSLKSLLCASIMGLIIYPFRHLIIIIPISIGIISYSFLIIITKTISPKTFQEIFQLKK